MWCVNGVLVIEIVFVSEIFFVCLRGLAQNVHVNVIVLF